jgi:hypothetical protein
VHEFDRFPSCQLSLETGSFCNKVNVVFDW